MGKVSLYVHIPFCTKKCPYCGFYSVPIQGCDLSNYIEAVKKELDSYDLNPADIHTIYIGGGSPSALPTAILEQFVSHLAKKFPNFQEYTIEVNPAQVDYEILSKLFNAGVNRISIGAQSFVQQELDFLGRPYKAVDIENAYDSARRAGFQNISLDLIFALPYSTLDSWQMSISKAISLNPEHISAYSLSYDEGTVFHAKRQDGQITPTSEETDRQMYQLAIKEFCSAGIKQYEISNFARPDFECKHNLSYWLNCDYIGVGAAAGSWFEGCRKENVADVGGYIEKVEAGLNAAAYQSYPDSETIARETAVLMLRLRQGIDIKYFKSQTGFNPEVFFAEEIEQNLRAGLIELVEDKIKLTESALPVADTVFCDFA